MVGPEETPDDPPHLSDVGNAQRLVRLHGKEVKYCHLWKKWMIWNGKKWEKDNKGAIIEKAKETVLSLYVEASKCSNDEERRRIGAHALRSESCAKIEGIVKMAKSIKTIPIQPEDFDKNHWILPVNNCTIDLTSGQSRPHNRNDFNTKLSGVDYDPDATCPQWKAFLDQMMDHNQDLISFLKKAVGYSLTGSTREQCIFILYGVGSNGKSTFMELVNKICGDFATRVPPESLLSKKNDGGINNDIARLAGARLVTSMESEEGKKLAEALIKQITGGEEITARFLHQEFFDFKPQFKLFYGTNHKPHITGSDHAIWRRIRLIPFLIKIADEDQDKNLDKKLGQELPGILNWALEGCIEWQKEGLEIPEEVKAATAEYRDEMDVLSEFMDVCCIYGNGNSIHNKTLKQAHDLWCEMYHEKEMNYIQFSRKIEGKGFIKIKRNNGRVWQKITLHPEIVRALEHDGYDKMTVFTLFQVYTHREEYIENKAKMGVNCHDIPNFEASAIDDGSDLNRHETGINRHDQIAQKPSNVTQQRFEKTVEISNMELMEKSLTGLPENGDGDSKNHSQQTRALILFDIKQSWYGSQRPNDPKLIKDQFVTEFIRRSELVGDFLPWVIAENYVSKLFADWNWSTF